MPEMMQKKEVGLGFFVFEKKLRKFNDSDDSPGDLEGYVTAID